MSTEPKQIFAFTEPGQPKPGEYVRFFQAFELDNGIEFRVRRPDCTEVSIVVPDDEATDLALKILLSGRCREIAYAKIPKKPDLFDF